MGRNAVFFIFMSVLAGLNLGTVRRSEDPIRDTQTNPILYEQKKEEEKDGKKGPLLYHVKNYPREGFFIDPPFEKEKKTSLEGAVTEKAAPSLEATSWWEEQPALPQAPSLAEAAAQPLPGSLPEAGMASKSEVAEQPAVFQEPSPAETVTEPLPESMPETEMASRPETAAQPAIPSEAADTASGKGEDYWW
mgnify:CR=1 FL=1